MNASRAVRRRTIPSLVAAMMTAVAISSTLVAPASASPYTAELQCDGVDLTYRSQPSDNWGTAQIVDGGTGHLTPTAYRFDLYDSAVGAVIFHSSFVKGTGHANNQRITTDCTKTFDLTLNDFSYLFDEIPPGTTLDDEVTLTFTVTEVRKY